MHGTVEQKALSDALHNAAEVETDLSKLPLKYAQIVRTMTHYSPDIRAQAIRLIRNWVDYASERDIQAHNPFSIRHHITEFAENTFGITQEKLQLHTISIDRIKDQRQSYKQLVSQSVDPNIFDDVDIAVVGGLARVALKMYVHLDFHSELPANDVDTVIVHNSNISAKAEKYHLDLINTKLIGKKINEELPGLLARFDCTMNQVAIHEGQLHFSTSALQDTKMGNIRMVPKNDPLFGLEGIALEGGNTYFGRNGFYRGLSFLLRKKGQRLIVSRENIEQEKDNIGRYWLVMLMVKIMAMKNEDAKFEAIAHWHDIAKRIGSTQSAGPEAFLEELVGKFPETLTHGSTTGGFDEQAQLRWLIGKLTSKAMSGIFTPEMINLPQSYTPANLELSSSVPSYDYQAFCKKVKSLYAHQKFAN